VQGEHALAEKGPAELHAIKAADQFLPRPALDRMGVAEAVKVIEARFDIRVDPGLVAVCAVAKDRGEGHVASD
jgi:hypothetical protein